MKIIIAHDDGTIIDSYEGINNVQDVMNTFKQAIAEWMIKTVKNACPPEHLLIPRHETVFLGGNSKPIFRDNTENIQQYQVGQCYVVFAAAPGTGRRVHTITKINDIGMWGILKKDTIRELDPSEVI